MAIRLSQFRITVNTAGVRQPLSSGALLVQDVVITADPNNIGIVHLGDSNVASSTDLGQPLDSGANMELNGTLYEGTNELIDLSKVFVDAVNDDESIIVSYFLRDKKDSSVFPNGFSLAFDGVDESVNCGTDSSLDITVSISVSFWINAPATAATGTGASKWREVGGGRSWFAGRRDTSPSNLWILLSDDGTTVTKSFEGSQTLFDSTWHHAAFTFTSDTLKLYVDGVEDTSVTEDIDLTTTTIDANGTATVLGAFIDGGQTRTGFIDGNIDEVSIWDKQLTSAEVSEIHNNGVPTNLSAHSAETNLVSWWRMGDNNTIAAISDLKGVNDGIPVNMEAGDIDGNVP